MKLIMMLIAGMMIVSGCSTKVVRTRENDAMLRVIIDPTIAVEHYVQIRRALVQSGKFEVIDRGDGFIAALREQDLQYRSANEDRFDPSEKWAHIGRMYGARGVITASAQCYQDTDFWGTFKKYCKQELAFIDSYTGRVEFAVSGENSEKWVVGYTVPNWDKVVSRAVDEYPEYFKPRKTDKILDQYMDQSVEMSKRENAKRSRAKSTPDQAYFKANYREPVGPYEEDVRSFHNAALQLDAKNQQRGVANDDQ